jgi:hypothetical protein
MKVVLNPDPFRFMKAGTITISLYTPGLIIMIHRLKAVLGIPTRDAIDALIDLYGQLKEL